MCYKLLLTIFINCGVSYLHAQNNRSLLLLDGVETSLDDIKKMEPNAISNYDFIKPREAVKEYGVKGRFGVRLLTSNKRPIAYRNVTFSATLYFIPDSANSLVHTSNYAGGDLAKLFRRMISEHPQSNLCIDNLVCRYKTDSTVYLQNETSFFNLLNCRSLPDSLSVQTAELFYYSAKLFISGTIYFSGNGFSNVITVTKNNYSSLSNLANRCIPGSIVTFENCVYKELNGSLSKPLFKSIKLE